MKRIAILGCENSHANKFLAEIKENPAYSDYEVIGVYSNEDEAVKKVSEEFGVPVLPSYDGIYSEEKCDKKMSYIFAIRRDAIFNDLLLKIT